ncbi:hypothetical protein FH972_015216 [Carpinus fangiana]|uniref:Uncharacterized protein n=1 Tax=Carpinus fangiana TaxID=176857 RepID=A0A5N6RFB4_9ROSI|nr:hypothetical protein FH972_015216 [Carpinus fangiana]
MAEPPRRDPFPKKHREDDAGAVFVLQSKGPSVLWDFGSNAFHSIGFIPLDFILLRT